MKRKWNCPLCEAHRDIPRKQGYDSTRYFSNTSVQAINRLEKFELIPVHLSINSLNEFCEENMAGSRATEACKPRQVRKEAAVTMSDMCCGQPGHH